MSVAQAPSTLVASMLEGGNAIVYIGEKQTSFANCVSYDGWQKLGLLKDGARVTGSKEKFDVYSGTPFKIQATFYTQDNFSIAGSIAEFRPENLNRAFGGPGITRTAKVSPSTTVAASPSPTAQTFTLASVSGLEADDEIELTHSAVKYYGFIQSISGSAVTLYEELPITPSASDAVKLVDTSAIDVGNVAAPEIVAIKLSKTMIGGYGNMDIYIPNAQAVAQVDMNFPDGTNNFDYLGIPFEFTALSVPNVESGKLARFLMTQAA